MRAMCCTTQKLVGDMKEIKNLMVLVVLALPIGLVCCEGAMFLQCLGVFYAVMYGRGLYQMVKGYEAKQDNANAQ